MLSIPPLSKPLFNSRISKLHDVNSTIIQTTVQLKDISTAWCQFHHYPNHCSTQGHLNCMMSIPPLSKPLFNSRISKLHDVNSTIIQTTVQLKDISTAWCQFHHYPNHCSTQGHLNCMLSIPPLSKPLFNTRTSKLHDVNSTIIQTTVQLKDI